MLYSLLGRLTWGIVKRKLRRRRRSDTRRPLVAALITAGALIASYRAQGRRRASRP
ncbi:MAG: hypothetical protein AVDCRST_MAG38-610 [uncultured Solirubrobacteraceae bacterium]|uniref:Uncharacterized protein n=1 Tax=uncultured Solirubrobacteraceae bacterium TaxID=1162706 RepID=A0A6J4RAD9_9ACTN|nr:MAG: hypothetical protein AVDCRST_MAG38-610 [uncultured Solirubrobacteraceae bacterium]